MIPSSIEKQMSRLYLSSYFPFILLTIIMVIFHAFISTDYGDDLLRREEMLKIGFIKRYTELCSSWSSRIVINFIMLLLIKIPDITWRVLNIFMVLIFAVTTASMAFPDSDKRRINWFITISILAYPLLHMHSAGWIATTTNYLWPLALGLVALMPIKHSIANKRIKWYSYPVYTLAVVYAASSEQMVCILIVLYSLFIFYFFVAGFRYGYLLIQWIITAAFFILHLNYTGNTIRKFTETITWFPDFNMLSTIQKIKLGIDATVAHLISIPNLIFMSFCTLLCMGVFLKYRCTLYRTVAAIPFAISVCSMFGAVIYKVFPYLEHLIYFNGITFAPLNIHNYTDPLSYLPLLISIILSGFIMISIYLIFENTKMSILVIMIFLLGFASRLIMAFSPTLYGSGHRTFIFLYGSFVICGMYIYDNILKMSRERNENGARI